MTVEVSNDAARLDVAMIHAFLTRDSYWAAGTSRGEVERSIRHSLCFGLYHAGRQAGFARVCTDFVRLAHIMDVFVLSEFRGLGYGRRLMAEILAHPDLQAVHRFSLGTLDAHGLYAQFGFCAPEHPERAMELIRPKPSPASGDARA